MKLHELLPLRDFDRIRRERWSDTFFLVKSQNDGKPLVKLDLHNIQIGYYCLGYNDLIADDWELVK